jgi:hypothetical protein
MVVHEVLEYAVDIEGGRGKFEDVLAEVVHALKVSYFLMIELVAF